MMDYLNYIGGKWTESKSRETYKHYNPANPSECFGTTVVATVEEVDSAVIHAKQAFLQWKQLSPVTRGEFLRKAADLLEQQTEEIAKIATKEMGKRFVEMKGEVARAAMILRYFAQEGMRKMGELLPSVNPQNTLYSLRVPLGVVSVITPWNFPVAIPIWKIAPALVYGNTVVWKPAQESGITAVKIAEVFERAGLPEGVLNLVMGSGATVGNALVEHPNTAAVTFTGSNQVGREIASKAVAQNKKFQLELGGKNPAVVLADADLDLAAKLTIEGAMKQTGQRCTATSRVYVEQSIYDTFVDKLLTEVKQIKVGDGLDETVNMGPVASKNQFDTVSSYIAKGVEEGAQLLFGGQCLEGPTFNGGYFIEPTIFGQVTNEMTIAREEIFGPVLAVVKVADYSEALAKANDTMYGLSASLFTTSLDKAFHFIENSEVGMVQINGETGGAEPQAPFGGMKESSSGTREQGQAAVEFFTAYKTVSITSSL
ncbi:aldehyde dehydrogenase family protein [Peribacillus asahii]|uniref:3-sulfolactaldehyde dehydrogenase n=1 Tax=Peribacillus asahii TaxID=228899 RepID=A0A398BG79_9BACI|nr:aldehyde dehydrogenase family protein [Peribacillus asahii]RID88757.1 aldehyde dehydrogenase family protein [Peribacillus asahii]